MTRLGVKFYQVSSIYWKGCCNYSDPSVSITKDCKGRSLRLWHLELWFLYAARLLNLVYNLTKYNLYIWKEFAVMITTFLSFNSARGDNSKPGHPDSWFLYATHILNLVYNPALSLQCI